MPKILLLEQSTIDQIAAGEVIERPASVVKELVENAIDAQATAITVEIQDGGTSLIRITDNGCGMKKEELPLAFLRHSTSKIRSVDDLMAISTLGFRGEALSSIAAVSQVELITKAADSLIGARYVIEGAKEILLEEVGAPPGSTFLVRNLFYNTPARQKFLKSPTTEASHINEYLERLALSRPDISFQFIANHQPKFHTSGNGNLQEAIYRLYGRDIAGNLIDFHAQDGPFRVEGFLGKPIISRGNRNFEIYYVNGRYVKDQTIAKAIEDAYHLRLMQRQYPFTAFFLWLDAGRLDVNVHPAKMELRFSNPQEVYAFLHDNIAKALEKKEWIPRVSLAERPKREDAKEQAMRKPPEPFEQKRREQLQRDMAAKAGPGEDKSGAGYVGKIGPSERGDHFAGKAGPSERGDHFAGKIGPSEPWGGFAGEQLTLAETMPKEIFLSKDTKERHRIIGQVFDTYWLVQLEEELYIIDQHAAHEKVLFERMMRDFREKEFTSQQLSPPILVSLSRKEEELLHTYLGEFERLGYEISSFGGREYAICAVPGNLYHLDGGEYFKEMLGSLFDEVGKKGAEGDAIVEKIASMSCKAAVKGNQRLSLPEIRQLIDELLACENPYQCPHGRPTIVSMSRRELEKKFKRIV